MFDAVRETVGSRWEQLLDDAKQGKRPRAYIGFEPSGTAHVGWMVCANTIRDLIDAGFDVHILLADWHAQINDKLGGDLEAIRRCGAYMEDAFAALGIERDDVTYRYASEFAADPNYWALVIRVAKATSLARIKRAMDIMGRSEDEGDRDMSKFLYPAMQVADIFYMGVDVAYGGMDQRHAHMLARDVAKKLGYESPVALHTGLVPNLKGGQGRMDPAEAKMSKSDPGTGIFLHDTVEEVRKKLNKAHCPAGSLEDNPVWDLLTMVVWPRLGKLDIDRPEKFGGPLHFEDLETLKAAFLDGSLHPSDFKNGVAAGMNEVLAPVRVYFEAHPENWRFVQGLRTTR